MATFWISGIRNSERVTDKKQIICKHCKKTVPYTSANTSTMLRHTHKEQPQLSTKTSIACERANNAKCLCISTSTVKSKSHGDNGRHQRFHSILKHLIAQYSIEVQLNRLGIGGKKNFVININMGANLDIWWH